MIVAGIRYELQKVFKQNIREYGMYFALFFIIVIFTIMTNGIFISSRNIANLLNQTGYIAILAVGMTLVIVIRHIDLSVGFLAGFLGAIAAIALQMWHWNVFIAIPFVLVLGIFAGICTAFLVARLEIPSFVASLAGWLIYRGALLLVTLKSGTIIIADPIFNAIGNGYIPDIFPEASSFLPGTHKLTLIIGVLIIVWYVFNEARVRKSKQNYNFEVLPQYIFILQIVLTIIIMCCITWILSGFNGLSWTVVIMLAVVFIYDFIATQTVLGRHIYAVGGNPEASELSGISVKKITYIVFGSMGLLTALSGILFASRLQSATTTAGTLFELDAIAAAYIGGVSAAGGVGKISGSLIGALVYMSLNNGMNLLGTDISLQYVIRGAVLAIAVIFDVTTRKTKK
jgi:putative multiple sugar transport system permease protein